MAATVQKAFRLPADVAARLDEKVNATEYVVQALREKLQREEEERFRASARRIAQLSAEERDVEFAHRPQAEVVIEG
ncbi:MAG TPA: hypothetical protein VK934_12475 [Fimbriimonas sp.]|nr:hypothetical protein [Fimbriimonas sp.]